MAPLTNFLKISPTIQDASKFPDNSRLVDTLIFFHSKQKLWTSRFLTGHVRLAQGQVVEAGHARALGGQVHGLDVAGVRVGPAVAGGASHRRGLGWQLPGGGAPPLDPGGWRRGGPGRLVGPHLALVRQGKQLPHRLGGVCTCVQGPHDTSAHADGRRSSEQTATLAIVYSVLH